MELIRNKYLLYPLAFVAALFLLDKLFLLPEVRDSFVQPGGMMYYRQREMQLKAFHDYAALPHPGRKLAVVFGDSRSFAIGDIMAHNFLNKMDWDIFNFSGPQALPAYHDYLASRLFGGTARPDYMLLGLSPDAFNRNSGLFASPVLNFGVDHAFIEANRTHIPDFDYESYQESRRFALIGLQFSFKSLFRRIQGSIRARNHDMEDLPLEIMAALPVRDGRPYLPEEFKPLIFALQSAGRENLSMYSLENSPERKILDSARGAQYAWFGAASDATLKADTDRIVSLYLKGFATSPEQIYFYTHVMRRAREAGVRSIVFWPRVNPHLQEVYRKENRIRYLWKQLERIAVEEGAIAVDLNEVPETECRQFYDASHLSFTCFTKITKYLLERLEKSK